MRHFLKIINYFLGLVIFTIGFFFLKISSSFVDISSTEVFFKSYLTNNTYQYSVDINKIQLYLDRSQNKLITNIKIDFSNKLDQSKHHFYSKVDIPIQSILNFQSKYEFIFLLNELSTNKDNPNSSYSINAKGSIEPHIFLLDGKGSKLPIDLVKSLWPKNVGNGARLWVDRNLSNGNIKDLLFNINIPLDAYKIRNQLSKDNLNLKFNYENMKISFLKDMSSIYDASGEAFLDGERFKANLFKGKIKGVDHQEINLINSYFIAQQYQIKHGPGQVNINADGQLRDLLLFLFQHPKDLKRFFPFEIEKMSALTKSNVSFKFPLKSKISFEEIEIFSNSMMKDFSLIGLLSKDFTSKALNVSVSNNGINILGDIFVDNQKLKLNWKQEFSNDENSAIVSFEGFLNDSFLNSFYINDKLDLKGKAFLNAKFYGDLKGFKRGAIEIDGKLLRLESKNILWTKPKFSPFSLSSSLAFISSNEILLKKISFDGPLISIFGDMKIVNNVIENANFPIFKLYTSGDNISSDLSFKYINQDNKLTLSIIGEKLKLGNEGLLSFFSSNTSSDSSRDILLDINFDILVARSGMNYKNVKFLLEKNSNLINSFQISANLKNEEVIEGTFSDKKNNNIQFYSKNIKNIIDISGLDIDIVGGPFNLKGVVNKQDNEMFTGELSLGKFSILKLPIFAKLLNISLPSLTSLLDDNSGINFKSASAEIKVNNSGIDIVDGVIKADSDVPIFGSSLGMTLSGVYGFSKKTDISGTLVPLEGFNTAPSKLPIVGGLFKGGEKGQGLIGINFRIYEDEKGKLNIQSNPLSILTPGFLQRIF